MKKTIRILFCALPLMPFMAVKAFAVWPPSTSLENQSPKPVDNVLESGPATPKRVRSIVDKLDEDERQLANVLRDLKQDEADLKKLTGTSKTDLKPVSQTKEK